MNVIIKSLNNGIKSVIINDPKTYNSLSYKTLGDLIKAFKKLDKDKNTKVIILEGAGKGFSAGHNLREVKNLKRKNRYQELFNLFSKHMNQESTICINIPHPKALDFIRMTNPNKLQIIDQSLDLKDLLNNIYPNNLILINYISYSLFSNLSIIFFPTFFN